MGALLAILLVGWRPSAVARRRLRTAAILAFVLMLGAWRFATGTSARYYHGGSAAFAALACIVIAGALQPGALRAALSCRPLAWIGRISYGLYLFHWPLIVLLVPTRVHGLHGLPLNVLRLALTFAAATLSFYLIELPIRERRWPTLAWRPAQSRATGARDRRRVAAACSGSRSQPSPRRWRSSWRRPPARRLRPATWSGAGHPRRSGWPQLDRVLRLRRADRFLPSMRSPCRRPAESRPRLVTCRRRTPTIRGRTETRSSAALPFRARTTKPSPRRTRWARPTWRSAPRASASSSWVTRPRAASTQG